MNALFEFLSTICVCLLLIGSVYFMNQDFSQLILNPLERMIERIKQVSDDPMQVHRNKNKDNKNEMNEANMIESAIQKISELLILGFG